jgi:hypothetical protein
VYALKPSAFAPGRSPSPNAIGKHHAHSSKGARTRLQWFRFVSLENPFKTRVGFVFDQVEGSARPSDRPVLGGYDFRYHAFSPSRHALVFVQLRMDCRKARERSALGPSAQLGPRL